MEKKVLFSLSLAAFLLTGCNTNNSKSTKRKHTPKVSHIVYKKVYDASQDYLEGQKDEKHFESANVYQSPVGEQYMDTFTKERGRAQSSNYDPANF